MFLTLRCSHWPAQDGRILIHRTVTVPLAAALALDARRHEAALTQQGQRAIDDVAVGFHDELFSGMVGTIQELQRWRCSDRLNCKESSLLRQAGVHDFFSACGECLIEELLLTPHPIDIRPLQPGTLPDFLRLFDGDAFADNPAWAFCYCQCFHEDHAVVHWPSRTAQENRQQACQRVASGAMQGLLAYLDGRPVGWCSAGPRRLYRALDNEPTPDADAVGAIMCFLVAPNHRGQGIASALLEAACESLRAQGLRYAEANPRPAATKDAEQHFGPLSMYLAAGFSIHRTDSDGSVYVRRDLQGA